jgi:hypothetical protein
MNTKRNWVLIVLIFVVSVAQAIPPSSKPVTHRSVTADLDGDGVEERLIFICYDTRVLFGYETSGFDRFVLDIPGIGAEHGVGDNLDGEVTVLSELPLRASPTDPNTTVVLRPGQSVTIVGGDDKRWCLVETQNGTKGWFEVERYSFIVGANKSARKVFDGLKYAD